MNKKIRVAKVVLTSVLACVVMAMLTTAVARSRRVRSARGFRKRIQKELSVALFMVEQKGMAKQMRRKVRDAKRSFRNAAGTYSYKYAEVGFVSVNAGKPSLAGLARDYGVTEPTVDSPVTALFRGGKFVAQKRGFLASGEIRSFIEEHFAKDIERLTEEKDKRQERRLREARRRSYYRSYWGGPYGYGGWGGYGWGGWPHRWHYGPRFGFGFGGWRGGGWRGGWRGGGCRGRCR